MRKFLGVCVLLLVGTLTGTALSQCEQLGEPSSTEDLVSFLRSSLDLPESERNSACIEFALRHLEYKPGVQNSELLVRYLGFKRPLSPAERQGFTIHGPMTESNLYPAIGTLSTFGTAAIPALLSMIANPPSELISQNATHALMGIFRSKRSDGIKLLQRQAEVSPAAAALNLRKAAQIAVKWCYKQRSECESALSASRQ